MSTVDPDKVLWLYEMKDLAVLQAKLDLVLNDREADMLYLHFSRVEVRCEDQRVGYLDTFDDSTVFTLDRKDLSEEK